MISSTATVIEGCSISQLDEVFEKINRQANGISHVRKEWVYIFYADDENVYFYSNPTDGQIINLQRGKAEGNFDLMRIKPNAGCVAAILLPKAYKELDKTVYRDALQALDTEERIYNLRQDCMFCDGERIGILGFPDKGIMKFTFCGNEQLRGDSIGTIKTLVDTFLEEAEYEDE
jgi:hypothetical protein